jgi:branched-chain amino acid transport system permease protein
MTSADRRKQRQWPSSPPSSGRLAKTIALVLALAILIILPGAIGTYWTGQATLALIYVVATLGTDLVVGRTGMLSLCQASFMGIGAYTAAIGQAHGMPVVVQVLLGMGIALAAGAIVAFPTLKLSGLRLAIITLLFGSLFTWAVDVDINLTGGSEGIVVNPLQVGSFSSLSVTDDYMLSLIIAVVGTIAVWQLTRGQWGRRTLAVRDTELAASSVGINVRQTKVTAFMVGALFCGVAGLLFGYTQGTVAPDTFSTFPSAYLLVAVLLGGAGSLGGAWLGGAYVALVPDAFNALGVPNMYAVFGGAVLVAFTLLLPGGLASLRPLLVRTLRRRRSPDVPAITWDVAEAGGSGVQR